MGALHCHIHLRPRLPFQSLADIGTMERRNSIAVNDKKHIARTQPGLLCR